MLADHADDPANLPGPPETPDARVLVVYRSRGLHWGLVPPLLILAAVAAVVVYRASNRTRLPEVAPTESPSAFVPRRRVEPIPEPNAPVAAPVNEPAPAATPAPALVATAPPLPPVDPVVGGFDVEPNTDPKAIEPTPPAEPKRRDVIGFDPGASLAANDAPLPDPALNPPVPTPTPAPAPATTAPPAPAPAPTSAAPAAAQPPAPLPPALLLKPEERAVEPAPSPFVDPAPAAREVPPRTEAILADMKREAQIKAAERAKLEAIKPELNNPGAARVRNNRREIALAARRYEAERRGPFHEEMREILGRRGTRRGMALEALVDKYGRDCPPEVMVPANRDLVNVASKLSPVARVERMRQWGLPESIILEDLVDSEERLIGSPGGPRNKEDVWIISARRLVGFPPASVAPKAP